MGTADVVAPRVALAVALAFAITSGLLAAAAVPPSPSPLLALFAMTPLFVCLARAPGARAAAGLGLVTGAVATGLGFRFLLPPMVEVGGLSPSAAGAAFAALTVWHAAPFAVASVAGAAAAERGGSAPLVAAAVLALLERVWPVPIPWSFGAGLDGLPFVSQCASITGPIGPSLVAFLASAALAERVAAALAGAPATPDRRARLVAAIALAAACSGGFLLERRTADAVAHAPTMRVGLVQPGTSARVADLASATDALAAGGAELVVWSEGSLPGVVDEADAPGLVQATLEGHGERASILVGVVTRDAGGRLHNAAIFEGREGDAPATYHKRSLLPFAERLPLEEQLPWLRSLSPRSGRFVPGEHRPPATARGAPLAIAICYEDLLSEPLRDEANGADARLLVNLTNDAWFDGSSARATHAAMARLRAIELGRTLVRATTDGATVAYGPDGSVLGRLEGSATGALLVDAPILSERTWYARHGAWPAWAAVAALGVFAARRRPPRRAPRGPMPRGATSSRPS